MKIFYHCYGSAHSSVVAAAIHLGWLPSDRLPWGHEINSIKHYDRVRHDQIGTPFYMGKDATGNEVYVIGMNGASGVVIESIGSLLDIYGIPRSELLIQDTLHLVDLLTRIGGFMSRQLGLVFPGRALTIIGVRRCYRNYLRLVEEVKRVLSGRKS